MMTPTTADHTRRIVDGVAMTEVRSPGTESHGWIVMTHGGCHGSWQWSGMQDWFAARGWNSVAIDWFSHGDSRRLAQDEWLARGIPAVTQEIETACATVADRSGAEPVVMGHSMGGLATLAYAASTTRDLPACVLLAPVVPRQIGGDVIELDVDLDQPWGPPPPEVARQLFYGGLDDAAADACYARLQPESPTAVWQATRWTAEVDVAAVRAPAFVVAAEADLLTPADVVLRLADELGAERLVLPGVGHGVTLDPGWAEMSARIEGWLGETARVRAG